MDGQMVLEKIQNKDRGIMSTIMIKRFPVFSEWCRLIAIRLEYTEVEAASLALSRARVASSNPHVRHHSPFTYDGKEVHYREIKRSTIEVSELHFMSSVVPVTIRPDGQLRGIYYRDDMPQICHPDSFDRFVVDKVKHTDYVLLSKELKNLVDCFSNKDLVKHGFYLWEQFAPILRDEEHRKSGEPGVFSIDKIVEIIKTFTPRIKPPLWVNRKERASWTPRLVESSQTNSNVFSLVDRILQKKTETRLSVLPNRSKRVQIHQSNS
jgi:hypothetical protein